jgi:hypothetical protein
MTLATLLHVCWLTLECAELACLDGTDDVHGRQQEAFWLQRVDGAQKRLLAAVRNLALARKMAAPDVWRALPSGRVPGEPAD